MQLNGLFADREEAVTKVENGYLTHRTIRKPRREEAIAARIQEILEIGESLAGIAIESGLMAEERVTEWVGGRRDKEDTDKLSAWLDKVDEDIAARTGDFFISPNAARFLRALENARAARDSEGRRGVAMIFGASGTGKTEAAKYAARMDHAVCYVLADGEARTWTKVLAEVTRACGTYGAPNTGETLKGLVCRLIKPGGLLIFDHAHLMSVSVMEQLLIFPEELGIGIAFVGNLDAHKALIDRKVTQLTSRASGATVIVGMPDEKEVDAHIQNLGIAGRPEREFCQMIGKQDGGLRFLYATVRKARQYEAGMANASLDADLLKKAATKVGCWGQA